MEKYSYPPIGEPKCNYAYFTNYTRPLKYVIYREEDFKKDNVNKEMEKVGKWVNSIKKRLRLKMVKKTPIKRKITDNGNPPPLQRYQII